MDKSISILLGAGFSAPMGYPIGNRLNDLLLNCTGDEFAFHTSGQLVQENGKKPDFGYPTSYDISFEFCKKLIQHFKSKRTYFDYEEFYDYMLDEAYKESEVESVAKPFLDEFNDTHQLISSLKTIYNQLVSYYVRDRNGKIWYDDEPFLCGPIFPGYTGILNYLKSLEERFENINFHTLNHDMFFESLEHSDWFTNKLCDGYEELGSEYYGELEANGRSYNCRLARYTGKYSKPFRLYKLHGSFDYGVYYKSQGSIAVPETYIKTRHGIGFGELLKEVKDEKDELKYELCWINYHADFLTGTTSKIERYKEPLIYKRLFEIFRNNLKESKELLIIGYGGKDSEINKMIIENFDFKSLRSYIIDPYPGDKVKKLKEKLGAKLIEKQLQNISNKDFE